MAKHQAAQKQQKNPQNEGPSTGTMSRGNAGRSAAQQTGESDENFDLISVIYHSLQGAETVSKYLTDTKQSNEQEIHAFMQDVQRTYRDLARRGKALLADRMQSGEQSEEEEDEEEAEEED